MLGSFAHVHSLQGDLVVRQYQQDLILVVNARISVGQAHFEPWYFKYSLITA
jgi:hypothetical protein